MGFFHYFKKELRYVFRNIFTMCEAYLKSGGQHFEVLP